MQVSSEELQPKENPIQAKIRIAEAFANALERSPTPEVDGVSSAKEVTPSAGAEGPKKVHVSWLPGSKTIVLAFLASSKLQGLVDQGSSELAQTIAPFYITGLRKWTTLAGVSKPVADEFEAVHGRVKAAAEALSGFSPALQKHPDIRHIVLTGRKAGGALAAVAAPWAKLLTPSADVRVISFDAPGTGNDEFVKLFGWLAYGYNATSTGQQSGVSLKVPVIPVAYPGKSGKAGTGNGVAQAALEGGVPIGGGGAEASLGVEVAPTLKDDQGIVHVLDPSRVDFVLSHLKKTRNGTAATSGTKAERDPYTGARKTAEGEAKMQAVSKTQLGLSWTNLNWAMHVKEVLDLGRTNVLNTVLDFPFQFFTRSHQKPSVVDIDTVKLPPGSDKSLDDYLKGLAVAYLLPAALLAAAAYNEEQDFRNLTGIMNAELIEIETLNAQCYVAFKDGTALLAFRGSDSIQDWLLDFSILQIPIDAVQPSLKAKGVSAHLGFLIQLESMLNRPWADQNIKLMLDRLTAGAKVDRVVVVGHSLGGALATLGGGWAALQYPEADVRVFTMGSPLVGNDLFVSNIEKLTGTRMRGRNNHDIVTYVPPGLGYSLKVCFDHFMTGYINGLTANPPNVEF
ncbi:hypothetical protein N2152v2_007174 [Parachlorella kessleri]